LKDQDATIVINLRDRFPKFKQIVSVFAVMSMLIYGWTTYRFIQKLPSWLYYLNFQEIFSNYSYTLVFNFVECLIFVSAVLLINFILPKKIFMDMFVARSSLLALFGIGYLIYLAIAIGESKATQFPRELFGWVPYIALAILVFSIVLPLSPPVRKVLETFAENATIFLYILVPLSVVGFLVVVANNLF
jgi:hypothetical protein